MSGLSLIDLESLKPAQQEQLVRAAAAADKLSWLVEALLEEKPGPEDLVEIAELIEFLRRRFTGEARQVGMNLFITVEAGTPRFLTVSMIDMTRMVGNLISNGIRHGKAGTVRMSVENTPSQGVAFRILDEGPGMDAPRLNQVVRKSTRQLGSVRSKSGIGFAIVRELAEKHSAQTTFGNRPEGGFEAVLQFPSRLCSNTNPTARGVSSVRPATVDLSGVRILLAEDNPTNQMVATQMLTKLRAQVSIASDGIEALEQFEAEAFDLLVVDIEMPRLSGLDVIRSIRSRRDGRANTPIVALTAYAMREHQERIAEAGANGLISKPISSIEALGKALAAHLVPVRGEIISGDQALKPDDPAGSAVNIATFEALRQTIGHDMMAELMDKVIADLLSAARNLTAAQELLDRPAIRSASHILISVAGAIGATRLQSSARELNMVAHSGTTDDILLQLGKCLSEIDAAVVFARNERSRS